ncbi:hypothetical protein MASR2M36_27930 [Providencia sp.]
MMHKFYCDDLDFYICISEDVIDELFSYRQKNCLSKESGGMLFTNKLDNVGVEIKIITTPCSFDIRKRNFFKLDEKKAKQEILIQFEKGFHYLGDWHTHNESIATPSPTDINSIHELFTKSKHSRPFFMILIIPNQIIISNCFLAAADGEKIYRFIYQNQPKTI